MKSYKTDSGTGLHLTDSAWLAKLQEQMRPKAQIVDVPCPRCDGGKNVVENYLACPLCDGAGVIDGFLEVG